MKKVILVLIFGCITVVSYSQTKEDDKPLGWKEGVLGVCLVALGGYILKIEAEHRAERKDWQKTIADQFDRQEKMVERNNEVSRQHISLLSGIKTLLEQSDRISRSRG